MIKLCPCNRGMRIMVKGLCKKCYDRSRHKQHVDDARKHRDPQYNYGKPTCDCIDCSVAGEPTH